MTQLRLHLLTERLGALQRATLRRVATAYGLKLVQLEALIYLSMANRYSDTPVAMTDYFGVTKGTISQTLRALEKHGLVEKRADQNDRRLLHCSVTRDGMAIVKEACPAPCYANVSDKLSEKFAEALEEQLRILQRANGFKSFGQCHTCRLFEQRSRGGRCGLTGEDLSKADTGKICREHESPLTLRP